MLKNQTVYLFTIESLQNNFLLTENAVIMGKYETEHKLSSDIFP